MNNLSKIEIWTLAIRPKTLPAAVGPVLVGTAFALRNGVFSLLPAIAAIIGAILLQIAANLANDYFDFLKGYDTAERIGPTRVTASGLLTIGELRMGLVINIILCLIIGLYLVWIGRVVILVIGLLSIVFAIMYSGGPFPLSSNGLGDIFVFIFFGLVAVNGTYYVQALEWSYIVVLGSVPVGLLITAILVVNNYRDIESDAKTGKFTLAVMMGHSSTRIYYIILFVIAYIIPIFLIVFGTDYWVLITWFSFPLGLKQIRILFEVIDGPRLNKALSGTAQLSLIYCILLSIGIVI